ncbi:MAG: hypothetical protein JKX85_00305, partial [Phycisphaeraceae bacterium]|nr:hypothetical protein [Phycisphaeraceae bacterium]
QAINSSHTNLRNRAQNALSQLLQTHQSKAIRHTALKQWVSLKHADQGLTPAATLITQHAQLANQDPYLQYVLLTEQWQQLQKKPNNKP